MVLRFSQLVIAVGAMSGYAFHGVRPLPLAISTLLKAAPVIYLAYVSYQNSRGKDEAIKKYGARIAIGLLFSSIGDMCLNVEELNPLFFLGGLGAFLIGHIFYVIGYCVSDSFFSKFLLGLPFYAYAGGYFLYLRPSLESDMVIPVLAYCLVIASMAYRALARSSPSGAEHVYGFVGALSFVVSDSMLAYNKFVSPIPYSHLWVMITYYGAQLLIAGSVPEKNKQA